MKKTIRLLTAAVLLLCMLFSSVGFAANKDLLTQIQEKGEMTIAMEGTWAPWTYHDEDDTLVGFDTEIGQRIAEKLGVTPIFKEGDWDALLAGLESGRYDLMINGVDVTEDRKEKYDFSEPYAYMRTALIVRADNESIQTFEDLKGVTTCNSINSTYMLLAEEYGATVLGVDSLEETLNMVINGRVDATLNAEVSYYDYMAAHPEAPLKIVSLTEEATEVAIPMNKAFDTDALREAINAALEELRASGVLAEISIKYFGTDITTK